MHSHISSTSIEAMMHMSTSIIPRHNHQNDLYNTHVNQVYEAKTIIMATLYPGKMQRLSIDGMGSRSTTSIASLLAIPASSPRGWGGGRVLYRGARRAASYASCMGIMVVRRKIKEIVTSLHWLWMDMVGWGVLLLLRGEITSGGFVDGG